MSLEFWRLVQKSFACSQPVTGWPVFALGKTTVPLGENVFLSGKNMFPSGKTCFLIFWIRFLFLVYGSSGEPRVPEKVKMRNDVSVVRSHEARSSSGMSFRVAARNAKIFPYGLSQLACTLFRFACTVWTLRSKPLALPPPFPLFNDKEKKVNSWT